MADSHGSSTRAILFALFANSGIAITKTGAAIYTKSGSMLAEAIHSYADCGNQLLLLLGLRQSKKPPSEEHPLGYGKATYFWSFMVAILLFSMGGLFSIYEGWHKLHEPAVLNKVWVGLIVLAFSICLEVVSMYGCMREINKMRGKRPLWEWLKTSRNAELVVIFGEDLAALLGLVVAFGFLLVAYLTGNPIFDAYGSISIGVILLLISVFVAIRVKVMLIGRSADPDIENLIENYIRNNPNIEKLFNLISMQLGPQIMLAAKVRLKNDITLEDGISQINDLERSIKAKFPEVQWIFIEPDIAD
jgi:cation diffusion facilitator family transporter